MRSIFFVALFYFILFESCGHKSLNTNTETISYLEININQDGNLPVVPYNVSLDNGLKMLTVCGTLHSTSPLDPMFESLEQAFNKIKPQKIIIEDRPQYQFYTSRNASIVLDGEIGFIRFLGNLNQVKPETLNVSEKEHANYLLNLFKKEEVLVYLICEQLLQPKVNLTEKNYIDFLKKKQLIANLHLEDKETSLKYFEESYEQIFQKKFTIKNIVQDNFLPIRNNGRLCEIARASYLFKDEALIATIESYLQKYDRVMVVFSGWHVLSIEPALIKIFNRLKKK